MARKLSKYGVNVELDHENGKVIVTQFERETGDDGEVKPEGDKTEIGKRIFDFNAMAENAQTFAKLYGLSKLVQDRTSDQSSEASRLDGMQEVYDRFVAGVLEKERESSGPTVSAEVEALAELQGVSVAAIQKALRSYEAAQREKILANPTVVAKANEIKAARAEATEPVDLSSFAAA